ncbi:sigma factor [Metabacillus sp. RGM 3146]|uniref:sigma factor n=1 Tax=Metabacillus sp. RGM 3146 TaxID=3401092 RepID=UPI003B9D8DC8
MRVWQSWHSFRQDSSFKTWVYRIASNLCLDKLRQAKLRTRPVDFSDPATSIIAPSETLPDSSWVWPAPAFSENSVRYPHSQRYASTVFYNALANLASTSTCCSPFEGRIRVVI